MEFVLVCIVSTLSASLAIPHSGESTTPPNINKDDMFWVLDKPQGEYLLPKLPFKFDALEPYIDASTMEIQYSVVLKEYTVKLNELLKKWRTSGDKTARLANSSLITMWRNFEKIPIEFRTDFTYYAGGYVNHLLYFSVMSPSSKEGVERSPTTELSKLIEYSFLNLTEMQKHVNTMADGVFGSGWDYVARATGLIGRDYLTIIPSLQEMVPLDNKRIFPLIALDLWEHAYFKKYGRNRKEYISNWWKTIDWIKVERLLSWWRIQVPDNVGKRPEL